MQVSSDTTAITAIATDQTGTKHQASVAITVNAPTATVDLLASPSVGIPKLKQSGPATLDSILSSSASIANQVASYTWDFAGTGSTDLICISHATVTASYERTGIYLTAVTVTDTAGNTYKDTAIVNVLDLASTNAFFSQKWNGMKTALSSGDIATALNYFAEDSKESFQQQFTALSQLLPQFSAGLSDVNFVNMTTNFAEFEFRMVQSGTTYSFQLLFVRDINGLWKIMTL